MFMWLQIGDSDLISFSTVTKFANVDYSREGIELNRGSIYVKNGDEKEEIDEKQLIYDLERISPFFIDNNSIFDDLSELNPSLHHTFCMYKYLNFLFLNNS